MCIYKRGKVIASRRVRIRWMNSSTGSTSILSAELPCVGINFRRPCTVHSHMDTAYIIDELAFFSIDYRKVTAKVLRNKIALISKRIFYTQV